ncbi:NAD(P)/FAD-dependent oxidoreductase [Microcoleus sp.]|uniref:NAD(P)/FAD-dependent oxidoreductase n=1 Tax=Microcoleus sp. TaxID=44472 RepID=UPI0040407CD0
MGWHRKLRFQNARMAAEAASLADPLSGEGIRAAIFSGFKVAEAIDRAVGGAGDAKKHYTQTIAQESATDMVWLGRLARTFYQFTAADYRVGVKLPIATESISKILCGELRYADIANRALKKLMPF